MLGKTIMLFGNGNTAVFVNGEQQPHLQQPWILKYLDFLTSKGIDPTEFQIWLPAGNVAKPFRTSDGRWNWEVL